MGGLASENQSPKSSDWPDFGNGFIVKMRKNTCFLLALKHFIIRKYAQEFPNLYIHNLVKTSKIQNMRKADMNTIKERLGNARSIR